MAGYLGFYKIRLGTMGLFAVNPKYPATANDICNRSRFTVIGSRLKKQKVEENYGVLF